MILQLSEPRKGVWDLARQIHWILRRQTGGLVFPETKFTLEYFKQGWRRRGNGEEELLNRYIFVCKAICVHNLNFKWAILKTEKGVKQMIDTEEYRLTWTRNVRNVACVLPLPMTNIANESCYAFLFKSENASESSKSWSK